MPPIDPSWAPVFAVLGTVVVAIFGFAGQVRSSKVSERAEEEKAAKSDIEQIISQWKSLNQELREDYSRRLEQERSERLEHEKFLLEKVDNLTAQFDEVIYNFAVYVAWARSGAQGTPPYIPDWVWTRMVEVYRKKASSGEDYDWYRLIRDDPRQESKS